MRSLETEVLEKPKVYFENLDGLRFCCFLAVFLFHSFHTESQEILQDKTYLFVTKTLFANGNLGVNFFFVLSGFLITYLLIVENEYSGKIHITKFWIRRILRIWPLYFFCVFFGFVIFPELKELFGQMPNETARPLYYALFLSNFDLIKMGLPDASVLGVLWSISVEEQFYLIWPVLLFVIPVRRYPIVFGVVLIQSVGFRYFYPGYYNDEFHTLSCIGDMAVGAFGAWLMYKGKLKSAISEMPRFVILLLYGLLIWILLDRDFFEYIIGPFERAFTAMVMLMIILEQSFCRNSLWSFGSSKTLSYLGRISYGLYCLHFIGILVVTNSFKFFSIELGLWQVLLIETVCALLLTIFLAAVSYRFFESPILKFKERFSFVRK